LKEYVLIARSVSVCQFVLSWGLLYVYLLGRYLLRRVVDVYNVGINGELWRMGGVHMHTREWGYMVYVPRAYLERLSTNHIILVPRDFTVGRFYETSVVVKVNNHRVSNRFDDEIEILC